MNVLEALISECEPYTVPGGVLVKSLIDVGVEPSDEYSTDKSKKIYSAAASSLSRFVALAAESEGGFNQSFDTAKLKERIRVLCEKAGINASKYVQSITIQDGSNRW